MSYSIDESVDIELFSIQPPTNEPDEMSGVFDGWARWIDTDSESRALASAGRWGAPGRARARQGAPGHQGRTRGARPRQADDAFDVLFEAAYGKNT